jgi:hypothetical protein
LKSELVEPTNLQITIPELIPLENYSIAGHVDLHPSAIESPFESNESVVTEVADGKPFPVIEMSQVKARKPDGIFWGLFRKVLSMMLAFAFIRRIVMFYNKCVKSLKLPNLTIGDDVSLSVTHNQSIAETEIDSKCKPSERVNAFLVDSSSQGLGALLGYFVLLLARLFTAVIEIISRALSIYTFIYTALLRLSSIPFHGSKIILKACHSYAIRAIVFTLSRTPGGLGVLKALNGYVTKHD